MGDRLGAFLRRGGVCAACLWPDRDAARDALLGAPRDLPRGLVELSRLDAAGPRRSLSLPRPVYERTARPRLLPSALLADGRRDEIARPLGRCGVASGARR